MEFTFVNDADYLFRGILVIQVPVVLEYFQNQSVLNLDGNYYLLGQTDSVGQVKEKYQYEDYPRFDGCSPRMLINLNIIVR